MPLVSELNDQPIRCTSLRGPTEVPVPGLNAAPSRWKAGVTCVLRYFLPLAKDVAAPQSAEQEWSLPVKDSTYAASGISSPIAEEQDLCTTDEDESEPEDRTCRWCSEGLSQDVHWSWHNAVCPQQRSTPIAMQMDANHQPEPPVTGLGSHMTLHEVLDHALFGPQELDLDPLYGNFPLQTVVEPVPSAPSLDGISWYHRTVLNKSLRRSTRNQPVPSEPDMPGSVSPVVSTSGSDDSDSEWETMFQPKPVVAADVPQSDHHVKAWIAVHASRHRPRPAWAVRSLRPATSRRRPTFRHSVTLCPLSL